MEPTGKRLNVLIIEDDFNDVYLMVRHLKHHWADINYVMVYTLDKLTAALKSEWDVILCDFVLPAFDGMTAFRLIRENGINVPFILVSGKVTEDVAALMMRLGANDYVFKNNLSRLAPAIIRELKYHQPIKEESEPKHIEKAPKQTKRNSVNKLLPPLIINPAEESQNNPITERQKAIVNLLLVTEFIRKRQAEVLEKQGLTAPQANILKILKKGFPGGISISNIKSQMVYKTVDHSRIIAKMLREGLVNKDHGKQERTAGGIVISLKGIGKLEAADKYYEEMFLPESYLSEENAKQINEALQRTLNLVK